MVSVGSTAAANKKLVSMFFEQVCNQRKFDAVSQYLTPDFASHRATKSIQGREQWAGMFSMVVSRFMPDFHADVQRVLAGEDQVWILSHLRGSPEGVDGKLRVSVDLFRVQDGFIAEHWDVQQNVDPEPWHKK